MPKLNIFPASLLFDPDLTVAKYRGYHKSIYARLIAALGITLFLLFVSSATSNAQELKPEGKFSADSIKLGEEIQYTLTFKYPVGFEVVFPGEADPYAPFELADKQFFPTRSDSVNSFDSVIYTLTTFEIDPVQVLTLPVYVVEEGDSTAIYANPDSVYFQDIIKELPDTIVLKRDTAFRQVSLAFNYPYLLIGIGAFLLIVILVFVFFGKRIKKEWQLHRIRKAYRNFQEEFYNQLQKIKTNPDTKMSEHALALWKGYMENLQGQPYTKMTTKEIIKLPTAESVGQDLRAIDRNIYGRQNNGKIIRNFEQLQDYSDEQYHKKLEEIKSS